MKAIEITWTESVDISADLVIQSNDTKYEFLNKLNNGVYFIVNGVIVDEDRVQVGYLDCISNSDKYYLEFQEL